MKIEKEQSVTPGVTAREGFLIISGVATYHTGSAKVKGELLLTSEALLFKMPGKKQPLLLLTEIDKVKFSRNVFFIKNGFVLFTEDTVHKFHIRYPKDWVELIEYLFVKQSNTMQ
ncbi:hypothetical protein [Robertkochia flava]|uniref:hypothetical protein n=1 Tax=Robertkochia flava TaxID=3447986 RepID=UPI001CD01CC9|nr:hypothetical protein [Robertkochia marina]